MMNPAAVWSEPLNKELCTATVTSTYQAAGVSSASNTSRLPVLATRVYGRSPASGAVDKKTQRPVDLRNTKFKKMAEVQGTTTVTSNTSRYEHRRTCKRIEAELKKLHSEPAASCHMFLGKKQKLPKNNKLVEAQSQPRHNQEICRSNHANSLHSRMNGAADVFVSVSSTSRSPQVAGVSTSAPKASRSPVLATRVYRKNLASGAVDKKMWRHAVGLRNTELKKMAEVQGTAKVINKPTHRYELRKTCKRMEAELKELHSQAVASCHMFLEKKQKLPKDNRLTETQSQLGHNSEHCRNNQAKYLHSQMNGAADVFASVSSTSRLPQVAGVSTSASNISRSLQVAGASTSAPNTSRSPMLATRVYRRNPASGAIDKKTRRPDSGLRKPELKNIAELQDTAIIDSKLTSRDIVRETCMSLFADLDVVYRRAIFLAAASAPPSVPPMMGIRLRIWEQRGLDRARQRGCVRKTLPHRLCG